MESEPANQQTDDAIEPTDSADSAEWLADIRRDKRRCLVFVTVVFITLGLAFPFISEDSLLRVPFALSIGLASFFWCTRDAEQHGNRIGLGMRFLLLFLAPVGLLVYLLTHGRIRTLALALVFVAVMLLIAVLIGEASHRVYRGQWPDPNTPF